MPTKYLFQIHLHVIHLMIALRKKYKKIINGRDPVSIHQFIKIQFLKFIKIHILIVYTINREYIYYIY